ncbi:MAG TPA: alpha-glucosidase [Erysipelotrichaceae bacterium]|nr:alpha-glucosidase [Erysipelotrichaceae bacterium]HQA85434.1 alpha-glucosidase [Erysipelotrichaceae bacterium]
MSKKISINSKIKDLISLPIGHDVIFRLFLQTGFSFSLLKNPLILNIKLKHLASIVKNKVPLAFFESIINLVNSELEQPLEDDSPIKKAWWKEAVFYQIYPRSFKDSNGDGIGDIQGIISQLDTLKDLGIDCLWLSPIYDSPNDDNGYDIRDYRNIMQEFGTMEDVEKLISELKKRDMKIIMDLVVNHTSDEHPWFQAALKGDKEKQNYYIFRDKPNNWTSFFSGSAWRYFKEIDKYALKLFSSKQMDLNWDNPELRKEIVDIVRFWLEKGIDGFRMDVINYISKNPNLPNGDELIGQLVGFIGMEHYFYGPNLTKYLAQLRKEAFEPYNGFNVGETPGIGTQLGKLLTGDYRKIMDLTFSFDHLEIPGKVRFDNYCYDLNFYKFYLIENQKAYTNRYWMSLFVDNHDNPRFISKIDPSHNYRDQLAKNINMILLTLKGTPFFYQGQEIGMTNNEFNSMDDIRDVESLNKFQDLLNSGQDEKEAFKTILAGTRDHCRTPMQWTNQNYGGFSEALPWIVGYQDLETTNVEYQQKQDDSIYNFTKQLIKYRKDHPTLIYGEIEFIQEKTKNYFIYKRKDKYNEYLIEINLSDRKQKRIITTSEYELILSNIKVKEDAMLPYEANLYKKL